MIGKDPRDVLRFKIRHEKVQQQSRADRATGAWSDLRPRAPCRGKDSLKSRDA